MGDFVGGMLKYLRTHPVPRVTIAGGFAKMTKLAQGMLDLHSERGAVELGGAGGGGAGVRRLGGAGARIVGANTDAEAFALAPAEGIAARRCRRGAAWRRRRGGAGGRPTELEIVIFDREGKPVGRVPRSSQFMRRPPSGSGAGSRRHRARCRGNLQQRGRDRPGSARCAQARSSATSARSVAERRRDDALVRPARAHHDRGRTVGAVVRRQLCDHARSAWMERCMHERGAGRGESRRASRAAACARRGPGAREHEGLRHLRQRQLAPERSGSRGESRDARRQRIGNAKRIEAAKLLADRAPDREVAGMQPRHVVAGRDAPPRTRLRSHRGSWAPCRRCAPRGTEREDVACSPASRHRDRPGSAR